MATIFKLDNGKWRAQVKVKNFRKSKVFYSKKEANEWAISLENEKLELAKRQNASLEVDFYKITFEEAINRYIKEVSRNKRGARWEEIRLNAFKRDFVNLCEKKLHDLTLADFIAYKNQRLKTVAGATVTRELTILSSVFEVARRDWLIIDFNPVKDVRRPPATPHRDRLITRFEIKQMLKQMKWSPNIQRITMISQVLACAFRFALRTGMRAGEICNLTWDNVYDRYVHLPITKNGKKRNVPLSNKAKRIITAMYGFDPAYVFPLKTETLSSLFRKYRIRANLDDFHFHDARHTAATWMAQSLKSKNVNPQQAVMDMCKIFGWTNISQALTYYNPKIEDIADRLN